MNEPRSEADYSDRQTEAARRVIVDVMQVLAAYADCIVLVGGWVPSLLIGGAEEPHVGSIDVDLALDARRLRDGRYAQLLDQLLATGRYHPGDQPFRLVSSVDLGDALSPVQVDVDFLAPREVKTQKKNRPKLLKHFRILKADGCRMALQAPQTHELTGRMIGGAHNTVSLQVAPIPAFVLMKAFALAGRDKPKDAYDICYCLDHNPGGMGEIAAAWRSEIAKGNPVGEATQILREKFSSVAAYGPQQVVAFHNPPRTETREQQARRAYELVQRFLRSVDAGE